VQFACRSRRYSSRVAVTADTATLASELRDVLGQLVRRLRAEYRFSLTQGSVLGRLERCGAASVGELATSERVRPQSMAQTVGDLESDGLVARRPDPADGRRALVEITERGRSALAADRERRDGWLANAIDTDLSEREQLLLARTVALLARLAESDSRKS
jgi:DNA-binding MarR family transcriptional regulator